MKIISVGIVGGGQGGTSILQSLNDLEEVNVVGITDINESAPGMFLARELGIFNTTDITTLLSRKMDLIIEVTGNAKVEELINQNNVHNARVVCSDMAALMMILVNHQHGLTQRLEDQITEIKNINGVTKAGVDKMRETIDNTQILSQDLNEFAAATMEHVRETDQIITLIDRITQQTNILGLNASIEAARAGEQGRGFSVVAKEVQMLASNSYDSTKKIGKILSQIKSEVVNVTEKIKILNTLAEEQKMVGEDLENAINQLTINVESH